MLTHFLHRSATFSHTYSVSRTSRLFPHPHHSVGPFLPRLLPDDSWPSSDPDFFSVGVFSANVADISALPWCFLFSYSNACGGIFPMQSGTSPLTSPPPSAWSSVSASKGTSFLVGRGVASSSNAMASTVCVGVFPSVSVMPSVCSVSVDTDARFVCPAKSFKSTSSSDVKETPDWIVTSREIACAENFYASTTKQLHRYCHRLEALQCIWPPLFLTYTGSITVCMPPPPVSLTYTVKHAHIL